MVVIAHFQGDYRFFYFSRHQTPSGWLFIGESKKPIQMEHLIMVTNLNIQTGTDANFEELVANSDLPVLVDFWAPWCGPCRMVGPVLEEVADEYAGRAKVVKVNVDEQKQVAAALGIQSIPTFVLFNKGKVRDHKVGAMPKGEFTSMLDKVIAN
jgi:thioredoxin 1